MTAAPCYVGIDVAKARLDIAVRPSGDGWAVANDPAGVTTLVARLHDLQPVLEDMHGVVVQASGRLNAAGASPVPHASDIPGAETLAVPFLMRVFSGGPRP